MPSDDLIQQIKAALAKATHGWDLLSSLTAYTDTDGTGRNNPNVVADAHLIANAPTWLAALVEEVERLRKVLTCIRDYQPTEVVYDDCAYERMVGSYRKAAIQGVGEAQPAGSADETGEAKGVSHGNG